MARRHRFFVGNSAFFGGDFERNLSVSAEVEPEMVEQLGKVLRVKAGDEVILLDNDFSEGGAPCFEYVYRVEGAHKKGVDLSYIEKIENMRELEFGLELVLCLPNKPDKLAMIVQKAVELGASRVTLVDGEFSQMKHEVREDRLRKIMKEAAEQSERAMIPELIIGGRLEEYLKGAPQSLLVALERDDCKKLPELLREHTGDATILIGPEGGLSDGEKALIHEHGFGCFSLGARILRMETAAIVALGIAALR